MDKKTKGAWVIHHAQKMLGAINCTGFECIENSGSCGIVLCALATSDNSSIDYGTARQLAAFSGIQKLAFNGVIDILKQRSLVDVDKSRTKIELLGVTRETALTHTADIYSALGPGADDDIAVIVAEAASKRPQYKSEIVERVSDKKQIHVDIVGDILTRAGKIGFVDNEEADGKILLFNGNLFRREYSAKMSKVLDSISTADGKKALELDSLLKSKACITSEEATSVLGGQLLQKLVSIGLYDLSKVSNTAESVVYVSRPSAYSKFGSANDDPLDESKALVASLSYGMSKSNPGRGRINYLTALMNKLISGAEVGPATAIGEDYQILERKRVIQVRPEGNKFMMRLLKRDVGELALQALQTGDVSVYSLPTLQGVNISSFTGPELQRVTLRKSVTPTQRETIETLKALRV